MDTRDQPAEIASEDGQPRKVSMEIRAIGIGGISQALGDMALGNQGLFGGFLAPARNGRGLLFHITSVEPAGPAVLSSN